MQAKLEKLLTRHTRSAADFLTTLQSTLSASGLLFQLHVDALLITFVTWLQKSWCIVEGLCCAFCASPRCTTPFSRVRVHLLAALLGNIEHAGGRPNICLLEEESQCAFLCALSSKCRSFLRCHSPHGCWALARRLKLGKRAVMSVMSSEHARLGTKQLAENVSRHFSSPLAATVDYTIWGRVLDVWAPNIRRTLRPPLSAKQNKTMLFVIV